MTDKLTAFISYSKFDIDYVERLLVHMKPLERKYQFIAWSDSKIPVGAKWKKVISEELGRAKVVVMFISADFIASDFIMREEYPQAIKKAESEGTRLIIICAGPCDLQDLEIGDYQMVNTMDDTLQDNQPDDLGAAQERIYARAARAIREALESADYRNSGSQ